MWLLAVAQDLVDALPGEPGWVPLGIGGVLLAAAIRFALQQKRDVNQDSGWEKLVDRAQRAEQMARDAAALKNAEMEELRRTTTASNDALRDQLVEAQQRLLTQDAEIARRDAEIARLHRELETRG